MRHCSANGFNGPRVGGGIYVSALLALGLTAGLAFGQAVDPVNISGKNKPLPEAAVPGAAAVPNSVPPNTSVAPSSAVPVAPNVPAMPPMAAEAPVQAVTPPSGPTSPAMPPAPIPPVPSAAETPVAPAAGSTPVVPSEPPITLTPPAASTPPSASSNAPASDAEPAAASPAADDKAYPITGLKINYFKESPNQPAIDKLLNTPVKLSIVNDGYVAPRGGGKVVTIKLGDIGKQGVTQIYRSGIEAVYGQVVRFYNAQGIIGVYVVVDAADIGPNQRDLRPPERSWLQLIVVTSRVRQIRTVATGDTQGGERVNLPRNQTIKERSPLKSDGTAEGRMDLLNKDVLDNYVLRLNRQPGRRVDVAVSGMDHPGEVTLDYLVSETRPWYAYAGISNTGTKQTDPWRERMGFVHNQLTGHDDILTLDYLTAAFSKSHAVVGSYDVPVFNFDRLRYKVFATYNQFTASDVGQNLEQFTGEEWTVGNELAFTVLQQRELFIDLVGGFRYQVVNTNNQTTAVHGEANYLVPYGGVRLNRATDIASTSGSLTLVSYNTDANMLEIEGLGRAQPTKNPVVLQFEASQSAYLEPLIDPEGFASGKSTLAHEVYLGVHGQYAFGNRLFPQAEDVAGGFYSVRGYPESIVAGDSVVIATAEYRFHIPRILPIQSDPTKTPFLWDKKFRFSPSQTYGRPDWDLLTRAFVDVAEVINSDRLTFESDSTLVGTGVGVELQYKQHFNLRVDWGIALTEIPGVVREGNNRFHISATILY